MTTSWHEDKILARPLLKTISKLIKSWWKTKRLKHNNLIKTKECSNYMYINFVNLLETFLG